MIYVIACIAGIAGLLFGFDEGIIAGALHPLREAFGITPLQEGLMTATVPLGALAGAVLGGWLAAPHGRRKLLLGAGLLFIIGAGLCAIAPNLLALSLGRLLLGVAIGVAAMVAPLYISETAPARIRGMLVSIYQLAITLGILFAYLVGWGFGDAWRAMFATAAIPGALLLVGVAALSDTPRWLMLRGRASDARRVIARIEGVSPSDPKVERALAEIAAAVKSDAGGGNWRDLFGPVARPALVVGMGLFLLQQLSGINAVIYFAPTVFAHSGFSSTQTQILATVGIGVVNVLMTMVAMGLIDRIGRRKLMFIGFAGAAASLGMISLSAWANVPGMEVVSIIGLVLYIASFAVSIGPAALGHDVGDLPAPPAGTGHERRFPHQLGVQLRGGPDLPGADRRHRPGRRLRHLCPGVRLRPLLHRALCAGDQRPVAGGDRKPPEGWKALPHARTRPEGVGTASERSGRRHARPDVPLSRRRQGRTKRSPSRSPAWMVTANASSIRFGWRTSAGVPSASRRPWCRSARRSQKRAARVRSCSTSTTAAPPRAVARISSMTWS